MCMRAYADCLELRSFNRGKSQRENDENRKNKKEIFLLWVFFILKIKLNTHIYIYRPTNSYHMQ